MQTSTFWLQPRKKSKKSLPSEGFEPSIPYGQRILSASRIPVPTQGRAKALFYMTETSWQREKDLLNLIVNRSEAFVEIFHRIRHCSTPAISVARQETTQSAPIARAIYRRAFIGS